jgi:hypothetical protein
VRDHSQRFLGRKGYTRNPHHALRADDDPDAATLVRTSHGRAPEPEAVSEAELDEMAAENRIKFETLKKAELSERERATVLRAVDREWRRQTAFGTANVGGTIILGDYRWVRDEGLDEHDRRKALRGLVCEWRQAAGEYRGGTIVVGDFRFIRNS